MSRKIKRQRGGQPGNHNARKHGFYSPRLSLPEICELWKSLNLEGAEPQIAILRIKLISALRYDPANHRVLEDTSGLLAKWFRSRYGLSDDDNTAFKQIIRQILKEIEENFPGTNRSWPDEKTLKSPERTEAVKVITNNLPASKYKNIKSVFSQNESSV